MANKKFQTRITFLRLILSSFNISLNICNKNYYLPLQILKSRSIELSDNEITQVSNAFYNGATAGDRYAHMNMTFHAQK